MRMPVWVVLAACLVSAMTASAQRYTASRTSADGVPIVRLSDAATNTVVSIAPTVGNIAYEMLVNGKNVLYWPYESVSDFAANPRLSGIPLLWPWANRIDGDSYWANGRKYELNDALGNLRRDGAKQPIHGLLTSWPEWDVTRVAVDDQGAFVVSRLEYYRYADLAAQFPFAHAIEMTYRLSGGELEVRTRIENLGVQPMPVSLGYHPYFQLDDAPRDEWRVQLAARKLWALGETLVPTGESEAIEKQFPESKSLPLAGVSLDHVFGDLIRNDAGEAIFSVEGRAQKIEVVYGEGFDTAVVYAPSRARGDFICFEPMVGVTNVFNLAEQGKYGALRSIPAGESWEATFMIRPSGF